MSDFNIDWDQAIKDAKEGTDPVPPGSYTVKVEKAEAVKAQSSGSPMIKATLRIVGGPHDGRFVWTNLVHKPGSPGSAKMFAVKVMAFGITAEVLAAQKPTMPQVAEMLVGRQAVVDVEIREWQGRMSNDVKSIKPSATVPSVPSVAPTPTPTPAAAPSVTPPVPVPTATTTADQEDPF